MTKTKFLNTSLSHDTNKLIVRFVPKKSKVLEPGNETPLRFGKLISL